MADDNDSQLVNSYIYEGLVRLENNTPEPALAAAWTVSENGLSYIFHLRSAAVFHDGTPVTADAVMANFNRWFDPQSPLRGTTGTYSAWSRLFMGFKGETDAEGHAKSSFDGIEKVDDLTVLLHLNRQDPLLLSNLGLPYFAIVNPNTLAAQGDKYGTTAEGTSGTGPYFVSERTADSLVIKPNPKYWGPLPESELRFSLY
jgi:peptide/nickel transport system substrate-binding protein